MYKYIESSHNIVGGDLDESKRINYIEDALGHEQFLKTQCQEAAQNLQDPQLKQYAQQLADKHQQLFNQFMQLI